jgi:hypothetical protein
VCQSHAEPDGGRDRYTDCYSHCDGAVAHTDSNCYSNGDCDATATVYTDAAASADTAAASVIG